MKEFHLKRIFLASKGLALSLAVLVLAAGLTLFGVIHSVHPAGGLYLPWSLSGAPRAWMLQFAGAYVVLAVLLVALARVAPEK